MSQEISRTWSGHRINGHRRAAVLSASSVAVIAGLLGHAIQGGAETPSPRSSSYIYPEGMFPTGVKHGISPPEFPAVRQRDPHISDTQEGIVASANGIMNVALGQADGSSISLQCGTGVVRATRTVQQVSAAHCLDPNLYGSNGAVTDHDIGKYFQAMGVTIFPRRVDNRVVIGRDNVVIATGRNMGDGIAAHAPGTEDGVVASAVDWRLNKFAEQAGSVADEPLHLGDKVAVMGSVNREDAGVAYGEVVGVGVMKDGSVAPLADFSPLPGNIQGPCKKGLSGAPVHRLAQDDAKIIGVVSGAYYNTDGFTDGTRCIIAEFPARFVSFEQSLGVASVTESGTSWPVLESKGVPVPAVLRTVVHSSREGFQPTNTAPHQGRTTVYQFMNPPHVTLPGRRRQT